MKTIKTYGVEGLTDWQCVIHIGKATATVHFEGGMMTRYGVTPAEYTTSDLFKQKIIEQSDYFKQGRIKLLRSTEPKGGITKGTKNVMHTAQKSEKKEDTPEQETVNETDANEYLEVEVACLTDAQNYLKEHFGIASSKIRSWDKAHIVGREHGIIFKGVE